jgi:hypothetical protein
MIMTGKYPHTHKEYRKLFGHVNAAGARPVCDYGQLGAQNGEMHTEFTRVRARVCIGRTTLLVNVCITVCEEYIIRGVGAGRKNNQKSTISHRSHQMLLQLILRRRRCSRLMRAPVMRAAQL